MLGRMTLIKRGVVMGAVLSLALGTAAPVAAEEGGPLALRSLAFAPASVDATGDWTVVSLDWTVSNADSGANDLYGMLKIKMLEDNELGSRLGQIYEVGFRYGDQWFYQGKFVSGTLQESTYRYTFVVPRYSHKQHARWVVSEFAAHDGTGNNLTLAGDALRSYGFALDARTLPDGTGPAATTFYQEPINNESAYAYVNGRDAFVPYYLSVQDGGSGFWKGSVHMTGPGGQTATGNFEANWFTSDRRCGPYTGGDLYNMSCGVSVRIPAGSASGQWRVTRLTLIDNAGNRTNIADPNVPPITVTSNKDIAVRDIAADPNPVNNWAADATVRLGFIATGAQGGVAKVLADFDSFQCRQTSTTPTAGADGRLTVPVLVRKGTSRCTLTGLAVIDAAGNATVFGGKYQAPSANVVINRLPNTTAPTALEVTLTPASVPASQAGSARPVVKVKVHAPLAPLSSYALYLYDTSGNTVAQQFGGAGTDAQGYLTVYGYLPWAIAPGTYEYSLILHDESGLRSHYGPPNGQPMPGGPLLLTVIEG